MAQEKAFGTEDYHGTRLSLPQGLLKARPRRTTTTGGTKSLLAAQVPHGQIDSHSATPHRISSVRLANTLRPLKVFTENFQLPTAPPPASFCIPAVPRSVTNPVPESGPHKRIIRPGAARLRDGSGHSHMRTIGQEQPSRRDSLAAVADVDKAPQAARHWIGKDSEVSTWKSGVSTKLSALTPASVRMTTRANNENRFDYTYGPRHYC